MAALITIGTDSEIFAKDRNGRAISLCGKVGGTKTEPKPLGKLGRGFFIQEDNVSVEFNIPPAQGVDYWDKYIELALKEVSSILESMSLYFSNDAAISFDKDQLMHPNALVFGCEPDYNAWTKMENSKPTCNDPALRTAGGHIHVGTRGNMIKCMEKMDLYLGVPSVIIDSSPSSHLRRQLYGKAGAMRPKPYGFEYRVLSNFWIFEQGLRYWVYNNTRLAVEKEDVSLTQSQSRKIQDCINHGDVGMAHELIKSFEIPMPTNNIKDVINRPKAANARSIQDILMGYYTTPIEVILDEISTQNNG